MKITSKYLILPINLHMRQKKVLLTDAEGKLVFDFDAFLDVNGTMRMYLDVERFKGMELFVTVEPEMDPIEFEQTDVRPMEGIYDSYLRPTVHFTMAYGWLNDPNGLVYHNGVYHLFCQHNPAAPYWGNMHWAHATSPDLLHWTEQDVTLFPDEMGAMFSGSAIVDKKNVSGLSEDGNTILLFYTAAAGFNRMSEGKQFTQCLAYSKDGGKTFVKYEKNPIVPFYAYANRDPKVIWCEELGTYIMAIYIENNTYRLLESDNLIDWTPFQDVYTPAESECPDIYPLEVDGERKWVLSGASDTYYIGQFDKTTGQLVFEGKGKKFNYGPVWYAAQTYSDIPDRRVKIPWLRDENREKLFCGQMGIPLEMSLVKANGETYLKGVPVREFDSLVSKTESYKGVTKAILSKTAAHDITVKVPKDSDEFKISLFGVDVKVKPAENLMLCRGGETPLSYTGGDMEIRMIVDTISVEFYMDGGLITTTVTTEIDKNLNRLTVSAENAEITVKELKNIWH